MQVKLKRHSNVFVHVLECAIIRMFLPTQNQLVTQILNLVKARVLLFSQIWAVMGGRKTSSNATGQSTAHSHAPGIS